MLHQIAVYVGIAAVLCFVFLQGDKPITGERVILNSKGYDIRVIDAPIADGFVLDFFSKIISRTRIGPFIRRLLLNDNMIYNLRELASQIRLEPLFYPIFHLENNVDDAIDAEEYKNILVSGIVGDRVVYREARLRSMRDYAERYRSGIVRPSDVMNKTLLTIEEWKMQGFNVFSSIIQDEVMKQAFASDARHATGLALSIFDGVPIAFKDTLHVKGHIVYDGKSPLSQHKKGWSFSDDDDILVGRLRSLGAIILGLTIMTEGGTSPLGYNSHFQVRWIGTTITRKPATVFVVHPSFFFTFIFHEIACFMQRLLCICEYMRFINFSFRCVHFDRVLLVLSTSPATPEVLLLVLLWLLRLD
jgi:hypothetical protein